MHTTITLAVMPTTIRSSVGIALDAQVGIRVELGVDRAWFTMTERRPNLTVGAPHRTKRWNHNIYHITYGISDDRMTQ